MCGRPLSRRTDVTEDDRGNWRKGVSSASEDWREEDGPTEDDVGKGSVFRSEGGTGGGPIEPFRRC